MAWEYLTEDSGSKTGSEIVSITREGRISFNTVASRILQNHHITAVVLAYNSATNQMRIERAPKRLPAGVSVHVVRFSRTWSGFTARRFLAKMGYNYTVTRRHLTKWNEKDETFIVSFDPQHPQQPELEQMAEQDRITGDEDWPTPVRRLSA